jgi:hypothetical protein
MGCRHVIRRRALPYPGRFPAPQQDEICVYEFPDQDGEACQVTYISGQPAITAWDRLFQERQDARRDAQRARDLLRRLVYLTGVTEVYDPEALDREIDDARTSAARYLQDTPNPRSES